MLTPDKQVTDAPSLVAAVLHANSHFRGQVWWRGQACHSLPLVPSVFRGDRGYRYEQGIITRFQQRAYSRHPSVPSVDQRMNWLFLMQHYRLPTRLLDWTESPLFAAYFAVDDCVEQSPSVPANSTDGALFALSPYALNRDQVHEPGMLMPEDPRVLAAVTHAFKSDEDDVSYIAAILPTEVDVRMMVQLSVFTLHGSGHALDSIATSDNFLIKLTIPASSKPQLREQLKLLGVRAASLFPDLEHLAQETAALRFKRPSGAPRLQLGDDFVITGLGDRDPSPSS